MPATQIAVSYTVFSKIMSRSEAWVRRKAIDEGTSLSIGLTHHLALHDALGIIINMRKQDESGKQIVGKYRLSAITREVAAAAALDRQINLEQLYHRSADYVIKQAWSTDLLSYSAPLPPVCGRQVFLRHQCPHLYRAIKTVAYAYQTTPSAVLDWAVHTYLANKENE